MAYHSEVLQKERDMHRRSRLASPSSAGGEKSRGRGSDIDDVRRAGGREHRFAAMAEAALAQVTKVPELVTLCLSLSTRYGPPVVPESHYLATVPPTLAPWRSMVVLTPNSSSGPDYVLSRLLR